MGPLSELQVPRADDPRSGSDAEGVYPGPDHQRRTGGTTRREARPGNDACIPVWQPEDDRRADARQGNGRGHLSAAAQASSRCWRTAASRPTCPQRSSRGTSTSKNTGEVPDGGHQRDDRRVSTAQPAPDRADFAGVRGGRADQQPPLRDEVAPARGGDQPGTPPRRSSTRPKSASSSRTQNVIRIHKVNRAKENPHFIMEFFPSGSLRLRLQAKDFAFIKEHSRKIFKEAATGSGLHERHGLCPLRREAGQHPGQCHWRYEDHRLRDLEEDPDRAWRGGSTARRNRRARRVS